MRGAGLVGARKGHGRDKRLNCKCYGCGGYYEPEEHSGSAAEVLCRACRNGAQPQALDAMGLPVEPEKHWRKSQGAARVALSAREGKP